MDEDRVIEKMKQLVAQAQKLQNVKTSSDDFKKWKTSVRAFLKRLGEDYLEEFEDIRFTPMAYTIGCGDGVFVEACREGINSTIAYLNSQIEDIREGVGTKTKNPTTSLTTSPIPGEPSPIPTGEGAGVVLVGRPKTNEA